jgi:hypothetical protein
MVEDAEGIFLGHVEYVKDCRFAQIKLAFSRGANQGGHALSFGLPTLVK